MTPPFFIHEDNITDYEVLERQKIDCRKRGQCLNVAIQRKQNVFACIQEDGTPCPSYQQMSQRELHNDVEPLLMLVGTIINPPTPKPRHRIH